MSLKHEPSNRRFWHLISCCVVLHSQMLSSTADLMCRQYSNQAWLACAEPVASWTALAHSALVALSCAVVAGGFVLHSAHPADAPYGRWVEAHTFKGAPLLLARGVVSLYLLVLAACVTTLLRATELQPGAEDTQVVLLQHCCALTIVIQLLPICVALVDLDAHQDTPEAEDCTVCEACATTHGAEAPLQEV